MDSEEKEERKAVNTNILIRLFFILLVYLISKL